MKAMTLRSSVALVILAAACSSGPEKVKNIDTNLDRSSSVQGENVGVKDGVVVVQKKEMLNEELRKLQSETFALEDEVYGNRKYGSPGLYGNLKACRQKMADKRLGGTGKLTRMEAVDRPTEKEKDIKVGIDEKGQLVAVSEEVLAERINRFKGYKKILEDRRDQFEQAIDICDQDYKTALINNGMNPADTKSEGEWVMDSKKGYRVWRAKRTPTDDPEELARRKAIRDREVSGDTKSED